MGWVEVGVVPGVAKWDFTIGFDTWHRVGGIEIIEPELYDGSGFMVDHRSFVKSVGHFFS